MAKETSRTFDFEQGRIVVELEDEVLGNKTSHSIYVVGPGAITDVATHISGIMAKADARAQSIKTAMMAAGWKPNAG